jgi:acyl carrier protein
MNEFLAKLAECLDRPSVTAEEVIAELPEWDSLTVLSVIAMLDSVYAVNVSAADLGRIRSAGDLWTMVQSRKG